MDRNDADESDGVTWPIILRWDDASLQVVDFDRWECDCDISVYGTFSVIFDAEGRICAPGAPTMRGRSWGQLGMPPRELLPTGARVDMTALQTLVTDDHRITQEVAQKVLSSGSVPEVIRDLLVLLPTLGS